MQCGIRRERLHFQNIAATQPHAVSFLCQHQTNVAANTSNPTENISDLSFLFYINTAILVAFCVTWLRFPRIGIVIVWGIYFSPSNLVSFYIENVRMNCWLGSEVRLTMHTRAHFRGIVNDITSEEDVRHSRCVHNTEAYTLGEVVPSDWAFLFSI